MALVDVLREAPYDLFTGDVFEPRLVPHKGYGAQQRYFMPMVHTAVGDEFTYLNKRVI